MLDRTATRRYDTGRRSIGACDMHHEFMAVYERDGDWIVAYCPEVPAANGQGRTKDEARASLAEAIALILEDRREDGLRGVPPDAERETIAVDVHADSPRTATGPIATLE